jgi:predicted DNA-binding transcriptional regulator AlpA
MRLRLLVLLTSVMLTAAAGERWLSITELAERWGMPVQTLYDWRKRRYGPQGVRLGRGVRGFIRYRLSTIEAWERTQEEAEAGRERASAVAS